MNYFTYSTGVTRKASQTAPNVTNYRVRNTLQRLHFCVTIYPEYRKEYRSNDSYGRRILDTRRYCKGAQKVRRHHYTMASSRQITRIQSRGYLAHRQERLRDLVSQSEQSYQTRKQAEINKATVWWHRTTDNSALARSSLEVLANARDGPRDTCATFMITSHPTICQGMLHKTGTCSKGKSVSYVHSPHDTIL